MPYIYREERPKLFTDSVLPEVIKLACTFKDQKGATWSVEDWYKISSVSVSSSWTMLAMFDYLSEIGYIREVVTANHVAGQHRMFTAIK